MRVGMVGVGFDLLAQPAHVNVDHLRLAAVFSPPHAGQQIVEGEHLARFQRQRVQQAELARRQLHRPAGDRDRVGGGVDDQVADDQPRWTLSGRPAALRRGAAPP